MSLLNTSTTRRTATLGAKQGRLEQILSVERIMPSMAKRVGKVLLEFVGFMHWWYVVLPALIFAAFVDEPLVWLAAVALLVVAVVVFTAWRRGLPREDQ